MNSSLGSATARAPDRPARRAPTFAPGRRLLRWVVATIAVFGAFAFFFVNAARFLEGPAMAPMPADFQVVLGGDAGDRVLTALRHYSGGLAPYVLLAGLETSPVETRPYYMHWRSRTLIENGVPADRILFDAESTSSWEEAVNTLKLMRDRGWRHVVVVSDPYHMRRLEWVWARVFRDSGLRYTLVASKPAYWKSDEWWRNERSGAMVIMEYIKMAYYLAKY